MVREALEVQAAMLFAVHSTREERAELTKLAQRVDALSTHQDGNRFVYLGLHEKLHRRIAECARCAALSDVISRTSARHCCLLGYAPPGWQRLGEPAVASWQDLS